MSFKEDPVLEEFTQVYRCVLGTSLIGDLYTNESVIHGIYRYSSPLAYVFQGLFQMAGSENPLGQLLVLMGVP